MTGQEIKEKRMKLGLSQEQFARRLGVTFSTINRLENGHNQAGRQTVRAIAEMDAKSFEAVIVVRGGVVQEVWSTTKKLKVSLCDYDNAAVDEKESEKCKELERRIKEEQME